MKNFTEWLKDKIVKEQGTGTGDVAVFANHYAPPILPPFARVRKKKRKKK